MTLSTQTHTAARSRTRPSTRGGRRPGADFVVGGVGIALALGLGAVLVLTGQSTYGSADPASSPYGRPTAALDGQTLAAYISEHESNRLGVVTP